MECPGCGKEMDKSDPLRSLASIEAHFIFCQPPGVLDIMLAMKGEYTKPFAMWAGRSIEKMVRALA